MIHIWEKYGKVIKEAIVPDSLDFTIGGIASVSFAGWMEAFSKESVHGIAVVVTTGFAAFVLHVVRYFANKWMPIKKDKK